jgi:hypothetical protein
VCCVWCALAPLLFPDFACTRRITVTKFPASVNDEHTTYAGLSNALASGVACEDPFAGAGQEVVAGMVGGVDTILHDFDRDVRQYLFE